MTDHPITPPPELVRQWATTNGTHYEDLATLLQSVATQATRWGADQELKACCEWLVNHNWRSVEPALRAARRPKPSSLKEQALRHVGVIQDNWTLLGDGEHASPSLTGQITYKQLQDIRSALETLND